MSMRDLIHLLWLRIWQLVIPPLVAVLLSGFLLLFVQPKYVSVFKMWIKEHYEESGLLRLKRTGLNEDTHIMVQTQILKSNHVFDDVVAEMGLATPPPSNSIFSNLTGLGKKPESPKDPAEAEISAIKAMHKQVDTDVVNPEILVGVVKMNDPHLAREVAESWIKSYRATYLEILLQEVDTSMDYLKRMLEKLDQEITEKEQELNEFDAAYPDRFREGGVVVEPANFASETVRNGPVPLLMREIAIQEMDRNRIAVTAGAASADLRRIEDALSRNRTLLDKYLSNMSEQSQLTVTYEALEWELLMLRNRYQLLVMELGKLEVSRGTKLQQGTAVTVLDDPSIDYEQVYPRKKASLMAAAVLGTLVGVGLAYLFHLLDPTLHVASQLQGELGVPVRARPARGAKE